MKEQKYFRQTCHSFDWFLEHVVGQDPESTDGTLINSIQDRP